MNSQKPVIFLSNFHPFISRNIFDSGAIKKISDDAEHVYVFVMKYKEAFLKDKYESQKITIIGIDLDANINDSFEVRLHRIAELLIDTKTKRLHQRIYLSNGGSIVKYYIARMVMYLSAKIKPIRSLYRSYVLSHTQATPLDAYYHKYQPTLTVVTDPFSPYDTLLMKAARRAGTKITAIVRSWDNFTTKEFLEILPDVALVQNQEMIHEGNTLHDIPKERFRLVGVPQFEYYKQYKPISREAFCKKMHLDPKKKIILFSPAGDKFSSTDWQICELLKQAIQRGAFVEPVQFLVRLHPINTTDLSRFIPDANFVIDNPGVSFEGRSLKAAEMGDNKVRHLADSLSHSDVVLNVVSSLIIDAAIFDKPIVTIGFDGWETNVPLVRSVLAEQSNEWLQVLLKNGLSPIARSIDELVQHINTYLMKPDKDRDKRTYFVEEHCWKLDGKAPDRIAKYVLE